MHSTVKRRQNTDGWWKVHINGLIDSGDELKGREHDSFHSVDDLRRYRGEIDKWLSKAASKIRLIYHDSSLPDQCCKPVGEVDFEGSSWLDVINSLKATVEERTRKLRNLRDSTPA